MIVTLPDYGPTPVVRTKEYDGLSPVVVLICRCGYHLPGYPDRMLKQPMDSGSEKVAAVGRAAGRKVINPTVFSRATEYCRGMQSNVSESKGLSAYPVAVLHLRASFFGSPLFSSRRPHYLYNGYVAGGKSSIFPCAVPVCGGGVACSEAPKSGIFSECKIHYYNC